MMTVAKDMIHRILIASCFIGGLANASPTVDGDRISWPDNGWYQVQTADGMTSLCNGTAFCDVGPGTYIVINHTTGERFEGIEIAGTKPSEINVVGGRINWPDNGWYQVQTADGMTSLCNGTAFCDVGPGTYIVINHTTGERFEGVEVLASGGGGIEPSPTPTLGVQDAVTMLRLANISDFLPLVSEVEGVTLGALRERELRETTLSDGTMIVFDQSVQCSDGGTAYLLDETVLQNVPTESTTYDRCVVGSNEFNGRLTRSRTVGSDESNVEGGIRVSSTDLNIALTGAAWATRLNFGFTDFSADRYEVDDGLTSFVARNLNTVVQSENPFELSGPQTVAYGFELLELNDVTASFVATSNPVFTLNDTFDQVVSGLLTLAGNGERLEIQSSNDDPSSYLVTFTSNSGDVVTDVQPWSAINLFVNPHR